MAHNFAKAMAAMGAYWNATNGNLTDVFLTGSMYFVNRAVGMSRGASALMAAGSLCAGEIAQGLGLLPGTYDPKDFLAAGIGAIAAVAFDKITSKLEEKVSGIPEEEATQYE